MKRECKIEGCDRPRASGAFLCVDHLGEKRRCIGQVREYDARTGVIVSSRQCKRSARPGNTTCAQHGANSPKAEASAAKAKELTAMQRFVRPYEGALDPITAFEKEFRRTYGRILWLEEQIANLEDLRDLVWGVTKEEQVGATEFAGTNTTSEARIHVFEDMLRWERKHFLELEKVWLRANLEERKLSMMQSQIDWTYALVTSAVRALGHDLSDPAVRDTIGRLFERELEATRGIES